MLFGGQEVQGTSLHQGCGGLKNGFYWIRLGVRGDWKSWRKGIYHKMAEIFDFVIFSSTEIS